MFIYSLDIDCVSYDTYDSHVVVANTEQEARQLASEGKRFCEGARVWLESAIVTLEGSYTGTAVKPHIICSSFNAG